MVHTTTETLYPVRGRGGSLSQHHGARQGTPWTSHQFITGLTCRDEQPFTLTFTFTPMGNLESPINLPPVYMFLDCGRKWRKPMRTRGEHANSTQCTSTAPPCRPLTTVIITITTQHCPYFHAFSSIRLSMILWSWRNSHTNAKPSWIWSVIDLYTCTLTWLKFTCKLGVHVHVNQVRYRGCSYRRSLVKSPWHTVFRNIYYVNTT